MGNWTDGYVTETDYVANYVPELNPLRSHLLLPHAGFAPAGPVRNACELGFGLGLSTVIHAATSNVTWWGNDFSPSQTLFARMLAEQGGIDLRLSDESFAEFCHRKDLPEFDFVALHGVWSWISEPNRMEIVDFLRRKLRVGGVVYMSSNALPGCSQMVPVRNLMRLFMERMVRPGDGALANTRAAQAFAETLMHNNPQIAAVYPLAARTVEGLKHHGAQYISHEYLNRDWAPMSFGDIAERMDAGKLGLACSASPSQHFNEHFLTAGQQDHLATIPDPTMRESVRDFVINRGFRKDYWIKGGIRPAREVCTQWLHRQRVVLIRPAALAIRTVPEAALSNELADHLVGPLLDVLCDHQPRTIGDLTAQLAGSAPASPDWMRTILCLVANNTLACAQDEDVITSVKQKVHGLNREIIARSNESGDIQVLASAVTGSGIGVAQFQLQMLSARALGSARPAEWAGALWHSLRAKGQVLARNGTPLNGEQENLAYLAELADSFAKRELPMLVALGCLD